MTDTDNTGEVINQSVQERLLNAAEELFCDKGFEGTSIRDIAASADCNIASVNYYFGGKQKDKSENSGKPELCRMHQVISRHGQFIIYESRKYVKLL